MCIRDSTTTWNASESACTRVNWVFLDQISGTATGELVVFSGANFRGEIRSRTFCQNPPNSEFRLTNRSEFTGPRGAARKNSLKLSPSPSPNSGFLNTSDFPPAILAGRSERKSFTLEKKLLKADVCTGDGRRPILSVGSVVERPASSSLEVKSGIGLT